MDYSVSSSRGWMPQTYVLMTFTGMSNSQKRAKRSWSFCTCSKRTHRVRAYRSRPSAKIKTDLSSTSRLSLFSSKSKLKSLRKLRWLRKKRALRTTSIQEA